MGIAVILGILFFGLAVAGFVVMGITAYKVYEDDYDTDKETVLAKVKAWIFGVCASISALLFIFVPFSFHTVNSGEVAVVKHFGKIEEVKEPGTHFDLWVAKDYVYYDTKVQTLDITTMSYSQDKQTMDIAMTVQYQIDKSKVVDIASNYGTLEILSSRIQSVVSERTKAVLSNYDADELIQDRAMISAEVTKIISEAIDAKYYVTIVNISLTNIDFSDAYEQSVEQAMIAKQEVVKAQAEAEKALIEAQNKIEIAKAEADAKIAAAQGDAEAVLLAAQAEAEAIKLKSIEAARMLGFNIIETNVEENGVVVGVEYEIDFTGATEEEIKVLSDYLQYLEYLSKWNGELPDVITDGSASIIIPSA